MHPAMAQQAHRPWPMPDRPWLWRQTWRDLLFMHWPMPAAALQPLVPRGLTIDEFDGTSWIGLVPFTMTGVTLRGVPAMPGVSAFHEMNLRIYVTDGRRPGVWFISLDAASALAVQTARQLVCLPYFHARMSLTRHGEAVTYTSTRRDRGTVRFSARYAPVGDVMLAAPGTLASFLTERYCLYTTDRRSRVRRLEIQHAPWPLQAARAEVAENTVGAAQGLPLPDVAPLLHFSRRLDVVGWGFEE